MKQLDLVAETEKYIHCEFSGEGSGHDWWHVERVRQLALKIGRKENADLFLVEMAALLHDLDDWKLANNSGDGQIKTKEWLNQLGLEEDQKSHILEIIEEVSFKGAGVKTEPLSIEGKVVQDADRLDAIGAIGIARTFAYGGSRNRLIYDPDEKPVFHDSFESYKNGNAPTINHFYEKLLLLKERMNTKTGKKLAAERHLFMENFLEQFFNEWKMKA